MAPKASSWWKYWCPKRTSRLQTVISTRSYMYTCKKHIDMLINYDAEGAILSKLNTLRKWRPRRHPRRISVPEGHLTPSTVISTRSHMYAWKKHIDILINYGAEGVILSKNNTLRKWRRRRHLGRILMPEGHFTPSTAIKTRSHTYAWKKRIDVEQLWRGRRHLSET